MKTTPKPQAPPAQAEAPLCVYEVITSQVKIGGVIAYRTARVNLTKEQAEALNSAQPDTVRFLGI